MRAIIPLLVSLLGLTMAFGEERQDASSVLDLSGYKLTFEDDFKTLDVSAWGPGTRWIAHTPWNGDFGDAAFADPTPDFPFTIQDGRLRIEARKGSDGKWSSGLLSSTDRSGAGFSQQYGYFEIRAKLPPGPGLWPGFWLIGNKAQGGSAEIDVLEYLGHDTAKYEATVHVWPRDGMGRNYEARYPIKVPPAALVNDFHTYGVLVDAETIVFYLDRREVARTPTPPEHKQKMFILISLAMGSGFSIDATPSPSDMFVDYVRAYAKS
ncbi:glycoside hydrolase family 16 protein [Rhodoblastus sp.]|uniref:glycoside hydrolase family 16 protein n=1 Tax=Rhodoblastus sp. TaxID=1962975 RepID=UPI003F95628E